MRPHHFFDWKGFVFTAKVLALLIVAGALGRYGLLYAAQSGGASPSLVLIQETRPASPKSLSLALSTTTSRHILRTLTVADVVPPTGKFIAADLSADVLTLYEEGIATAKYRILAEGERGSPYEISTGFYTVTAKEKERAGGDGELSTSWNVQFYPNYFIHGWPAYTDGTPVDFPYEGGSIRLDTADAEKVYAFAEEGVGIFVYDPARTRSAQSLSLGALPAPSLSSLSYLVADLDTGDVFLEQNAMDVVPVASTTRVMTALVASEAVPLETEISLPRNALPPSKRKTAKTEETFQAGELLAPLLMSPDQALAEGLASARGGSSFVDWMNAKALSLDMRSTRFMSAVGTSTENVSTAEDLFRLAAYLAQEKPFALSALRTPDLELMADSGNAYYFSNEAAARETALSTFPLLINGIERHIAVIVLRSGDTAGDTKALADWLTQSVVQGAELTGTACLTCAIPPPYRKIPL